MRALIARWSGNSLLAGLWGCSFGTMNQSVTAVAFILASLMGGGLMPVRRALPVVACANLGTAVLVLVASFDLRPAVLYVPGVASIAWAFEIGGRRLRSLFAALSFAALLFFGLRLMKEASAPLPTFAWFGGFVRLLQSSNLLAYLAGGLLRLLIRSSPAIAVIAIALGRGGRLTDDQVIGMIFGTGLGVGGSVALLASNLKAVPKQIAMARLPQMLDTVRAETTATAPVPAAVLHRATQAVADETQAFLRGVADRISDRETSARLLLLERRQALLRGLNDTVHDFVQAAATLRTTATLARLADSMLEGLHAVVVTAPEATGRREGPDRALLLEITDDRGDLMEKLRGNALSAAPDLPHEAKTQLIHTTSLFERAVWMLRQWTLTLPAAPGVS